MGRQALVPNYARLAQLQGHEVLVWGVSHPAGRQIAHAMRQFGAHVWCGDCDRAAAGEVAYEVGGDVLVREPLCGTWPRGAEEDEAGPARQRAIVLAMTPAQLPAHPPLADPASLREMLAPEGGDLVLALASPDARGVTASARDALRRRCEALADELAEAGIRVNAVTTPTGEGTHRLAALCAFLCCGLSAGLVRQTLCVEAEDLGLEALP